MKKITAVLLVLCVAATLFAAGSVRVGGAFNFTVGKSAEFAEDAKNVVLAKEKVGYKTNGFGFDVAGDFDVANNLSVWADFNMVFCSDAKYKVGDNPEISIKDQYDVLKKIIDVLKDEASAAGVSITADLKKAINIISIGAGVAYKFDLNPVDIKLGGGLFFERALAQVKFEYAGPSTYTALSIKASDTFKTSNFGISLYGDVKYKFNGKWGLGLTVMPHIGLVNTTSYESSFTYTGDLPEDFPSIGNLGKDSTTGFRVSFSMPIVVGVSYSF